MLKSPRITMRDLILLVVVIAVDFAWVRRNIATHQSLCGMNAPAFDIGILGMASCLLILGVLAVQGRVRRTPMAVGFALGGVLALGIVAYLGRWQPDLFRIYLNFFIWSASAYLGIDRHGNWPIYLGNLVILLLPQLALAGAVGLGCRAGVACWRMATRSHGQVGGTSDSGSEAGSFHSDPR